MRLLVKTGLRIEAVPAILLQIVLCLTKTNQLIITGHEDDHNILFYAQDITPLDFVMTKFKRLQGGISKFGEELSGLSENENNIVISAISNSGKVTKVTRTVFLKR